MDWNGFKKLVAHTAGRKATCKNNKVFITPIGIALVIQDVYLYYKLNKRKVKVDGVNII
jgi:hypothetical protein